MNVDVHLTLGLEDIRIPGQFLYEESTRRSPTLVVVTRADGTVERYRGARPYLLGDPLRSYEEATLVILSQPVVL